MNVSNVLINHTVRNDPSNISVKTRWFVDIQQWAKSLIAFERSTAGAQFIKTPPIDDSE